MDGSSRDEHAGRAVLVTGGASGIGLASARLLAARGARVAVLDRDAAAVEAAVAPLPADAPGGPGGGVVGVVVDVRDHAAVREAVAEVVEEFGGLDGLVTAAGIQRYGDVVGTPVELWDEVLEVNARGVFSAAQAALPALRRSAAGAVVIVSSVQAQVTQPQVAAYTASKGALTALGRAVAVDEAAHGVRCNVVSPGSVDTPMLRRSAALFSAGTPAAVEATVGAWGATHPLGRAARAEEVAEVVAFLVGPRSSFVTGADLRVDGGLLARIGVPLGGGLVIRLSMGHVDTYDDRTAAFARQLGLGGVQLHAPTNLPAEAGYWTVADLAALRARCTADGLRIDGLENVPLRNFGDVQTGGPRRDEQLDGYRRTLRNMAATGYDLLGYNFLATYVWRTDMRAAGRGGATVTAFDLARARSHGNALAAYKLTPQEPVPALTADELWANHRYFLDAVLPVAQECGIRLALHPDDPPVDAPLGGAARILTSPAALRRAHGQAGGSPAWALNLCLGTVSEMGGQAAADEVIDFFGPRGAIAYVHFRDVRGTVPAFAECFLGEGNLDPAAVLRRLHRTGFDGFVIDDHVPALVGDPDTWGDTSSAAYCSRGRAHAVGYLQGVLDGLGLDR